MDYVSWRRELERDAENLELLSLMIADITSKHDTKLQTLFDLIRKKIKHPINPGNKKIIISRRFPIPQTIFCERQQICKREFRAGNGRDHRHG